MKDLVARLNDYLRMMDSEVLQNVGTVSHALAEQRAKEEYQKYKQLNSGGLTRAEQAFLGPVEAAAKRLEGKKLATRSRHECLLLCCSPLLSC